MDSPLPTKTMFGSEGATVMAPIEDVDSPSKTGNQTLPPSIVFQTPRYVSIVREVRLVSGDVTLLRADTGLVPAGKDDIDPALNAVQSMVAVQKGAAWKIALFHNTPAAYHMRPELGKQLTEELRAKLKQKPRGD